MMEKFHYQGKDYDLIAYDSHHLMMYGNFGVKDVAIVSHGQVQTTVFGINNKNILMVKEHRVMGQADQPIGKIYPEYDGSGWSIYDLHKLILYTGRIFIGNPTTSYSAFGEAFYSKFMAEEPVQCYELSVEDGKVSDIIDYSEFVTERARENPKVPTNLTELQPKEKHFPRMKKQVEWQVKFLPREYKYIYPIMDSYYINYYEFLKIHEGK